MKTKKLLLVTMLIGALYVVSCGTKHAAVDVLKPSDPSLYSFCGLHENIELSDRYTLNYNMDLNFDTENIKVLWKKAVVIDKQSNDSVNVDMKDLRCKLISNPPIVFAGTFDVHHQNQHYIIHFLQDMRTYINKKNGGMKVMQECHNVADLDSNLLYKFQKPEKISRK